MQTTEARLNYFEKKLPYVFRDRRLFENAFIAGDIYSPDNRVGNRDVALVGDTVIAAVIASEEDQQKALSLFKSKEKCGELARLHSLDKIVRICSMQRHIGPQPTVLKNTIAAVVGAVWVDSTQDYRAVLGAMAYLGLVNCTSPSPDSTEVDFEAFVDLDMCASESAATAPVLPETVSQPPNCVTTCTLADLTVTRGSGSPAMPCDTTNYPRPTSPQFRPDEQPVAFEGSSLLLSDVGTVAQSTPEDASISDDILPLAAETVSHASDERQSAPAAVGLPRTDSMSPLVQRDVHKQTPVVPKKKAKATSRVKVADMCISSFKLYLAQEREKLADRHDEFLHYYNHMLKYGATLDLIDHPKLGDAATIALQFGSPSSMILVKRAVSSARSPLSTDRPVLFVRRNLSEAQLLAAIRRLDIEDAHLRLARWLHIHALYIESTRKAGGVCYGDFHVTTSVPPASDAASTSMGVPGNPRNMELREAAQCMADQTGLVNDPDSSSSSTLARAKKLRRTGLRLQMIVHRWGVGALALLDSSFTDQLMMSLSDRAFEQLIKTMDRFEGGRITAVSRAAARAIDMLMEGNIVPNKLRIEDVDETVLEEMPRFSTQMEHLFDYVE